MPLEHRSSDTARQGRDYRSTPPAKQIRFPLRRRKVRWQSNGLHKRESASLKQQTLTQMDFISSSFSEEVTFTDDDASDEASGDHNYHPAIPRRASEAKLTKKLQESTRESIPIIQDSCDSSDGGFHDDASAEASPLQCQPGEERRAAEHPNPLGRLESLDAVRASPRRRAYMSRHVSASKRLKQNSQADDASPPAHLRSSAEQVDDREIPDSDEDNEELQVQDYMLTHQETFLTGHETQLIMEELASLEYPEPGDEGTLTNKLLISAQRSPTPTLPKGAANSEPVLLIASTQSISSTIFQTPTFSSPPSPPPTTTTSPDNQPELIRRHKGRAPTPTALPKQGQFFESQRVPLHVLQSFAPASARTDILLPTPSEVLHLIIDGAETCLRLAYRVPEQVQRFWLFDHGTLRYMACVQPGKPRGPGWDYHIEQVYELNNPVEERDMREEGWVNGQVRRYIYLPPAIVGQLLWNLRCATLDGGGIQIKEGDSGKPGISDRRPSSCNSSRSPVISSLPVTQADTYISDRDDIGQPSSLLFQDHGSSVATLPTNVIFDSSPLLTKSQMLPDSLVSDAL
ncbi:hypothetical protein TARUN_1921 [Trichoderma arundinaceum]|uniref:Uncharacterized protein n=1 Tax=Trichoderma arundinaceum TaxID=490622 RepID=A0A395NVW9_TRIAR|nr:hypothetical protein TARUN_1921 [Trichoderma arundinaceum]